MTKEEQDKKHQEEIDLIHQLQPELGAKHQAEIDLIHQLQPDLKTVGNSAPPLWWRGKPEDWTSATPESRQTAINIHDGQHTNPVVSPGPILIDKNLPDTPPPRQARSIFNLGDWTDLFKGMYQNGRESLGKFGHSVYETAIDPYGAANAFTNGLPTPDKVESAVNAAPGVIAAAPAVLGGLALNQFSDEVQQAIIAKHPELAPPIEKGRTASENIHNAGQAVANYLKPYGSGDNEGWGTGLYYSLHDKPFQSLADLSVPATLGGAGLARMGLNAAWRAGLAERMVAQGIPNGLAQTAVNAPRVAMNMMNPINWVTYPAGKVVSGTTRAVANALTPQRRAMMALVNNDIEKAKQVEAKLKHTIANPIIEGSNPTAAEALEPNPHGAGPVPQLPGGPATTLALDAAPSVDSLLLDGHNLDAITGPRPPIPGEPAPGGPAAALALDAAPGGPAAPVRPTNVLNRDTPPGAAPPQPQMTNALNEARPVEPEAPPAGNGEWWNDPEQWAAYERRAAEAEAARTAPQPEPEAPPQPKQEAPAPEPEPTPQPEPEAAKTEPEAAPASDYDFMGRTKEVQDLIKLQPEMEQKFKFMLARAEKGIPKEEAGLLASSKYGKKYIEIAKMENLAQQEAAFESWISDEPADKVDEIERYYIKLKNHVRDARGAEVGLARIPKDLEGWHDILDKLARGEEGHLDINTIAADINKRIAAYHAANAAAGVVTLPPHPGIGVRGVPRPGTPGVVATKFSAAGEQARLNRPDQFTDLYNQNNAARMKVNNSIGKTGPAGNVDRPTAEAQHDALAKVEFDKGRTKLSTSDATFRRITSRPLSNTVMERARKYMGEGGEAFQIGSYVPAHIDAAGNRVAAVYPKYSGKALQAIKQAFDDLAFDKRVIDHGGLSEASVRQIQGTRAEFLRWVGLRGNNPELITAMKNYSARENQIARMKLAEHLESVMQKPISDEYTLRQRADAYANAIKESNQSATLEAATGRRMHRSFDQLLTPKELENIQAIKDDLTREALAKDHARAGRDHGSLINTTASDGIGATHIPGHNGMLNQLREAIMGGTDERVKGRISKGMETAEGGLKLMSNALRQQEGFDIVGEAARRTGRVINNLTTKVPTIYNVTEQQRDAKKQKGGTR